VNRHAGLAEECDEVGITPGDPGDVPLNGYPPAPGGGGRVHDDRSGVHTANGATDRPIPRAWAPVGTLRCSRDWTRQQSREAAPRPVPGNGLSGAWLTAAVSGRPGRTPPCALPTKRVRLRIQLPGPPHQLVARQAASTARFSRAEPLRVTDARARQALPLSRSADRVTSMRGRRRFSGEAARGGWGDPLGLRGLIRRWPSVAGRTRICVCSSVGAHVQRKAASVYAGRLPNRVIKSDLPFDGGR
jgi:hypothetical protein